MDTYRLTGRKLREWTRRYLPGEIAGTTCEMGGAAITYAMTSSLSAAALAATIGACFGWYAAAYVAAVRTAYRAHRSAAVRSRALTANALALRSIVVEFGPAEALDSLLVRPLAFYYGPILFDGNVAGWVFAKCVADVGFYALTIVSYERFNRLLVVRRNVEEVPRESVATIAAA